MGNFLFTPLTGPEGGRESRHPLLLTATFLLFGKILNRFLTRFLARFLTRFLARFLTRVFTRFLARFLTINTVYSTTGAEKYSVQYYSDGKIYYTVLFLKESLNFFLPPPWASKPMMRREGETRGEKDVEGSAVISFESFVWMLRWVRLRRGSLLRKLIENSD